MKKSQALLPRRWGNLTCGVLAILATSLAAFRSAASDGTVFVGGTNRGWGSNGTKPFTFERVRWTGKTPFEIHPMSALKDGFELTFTESVDRATAGKPESYSMDAWTSIYQAEYGSPEVDQAAPKITAAEVSPDGKKSPAQDRRPGPRPCPPPHGEGRHLQVRRPALAARGLADAQRNPALSRGRSRKVGHLRQALGPLGHCGEGRASPT